jgi:hypothetical protein
MSTSAPGKHRNMRFLGEGYRKNRSFSAAPKRSSASSTIRYLCLAGVDERNAMLAIAA